MQVIRPRLRAHANLAHIAAVGRRVVRHFDFDFLNSVLIHVHDRTFHPVVIVVQTVDVIADSIFSPPHIQLLCTRTGGGSKSPSCA